MGSLLRRAGGRIERWQHESESVFETAAALAINEARLAHLDGLGLPLEKRRVLEVGAGIGLLTGFFLAKGCNVVSTEGRADNVDEMRRRFPTRETKQLDLDDARELASLGRFDVAFCYGLLYHLARPAEALAALAAVSDLLLLETCVSPGHHVDVHRVRESDAANQALVGVGCRPTRPWVMAELTRGWGHAYTTVEQPNHPDFETDWTTPLAGANRRAVFVASRTPIASAQLTTTLPDRQARSR